jgi:hypothetical protein
MPNVNVDIKARDQASGKIKGLTSSIMTAQLATQAITAAARKLVEVGKKAVETFKAQEQAESRLAAALGTGIQQFKDFASEMQASTTIGDETTLGVLQLASSMGVANDRLTEAATAAIGLSKALGISEKSAVKMVAAYEAGNTTLLNRYIPALKEASTEGEKQALVQEAVAKGMDIARAEADTFTGRLTQLSNVQGDLSEDFGRVIAVVGKDYVEAMINGAGALQQFTQDADTIGPILGHVRASLALFGDVLGRIFDTYKDVYSSIFFGLIDNVKQLGESITGGKSPVTGFQVLAGALQGASMALGVVTDMINTGIEAIFDYYTALVETAKVVGETFKVLTGQAEWSDVKDQVFKAGEAFKDLGVDVALNLKKSFDTVKDQVIDFREIVNEQADAMASDYTDTFDRINKAMHDSLDGGTTDLENQGNEADKTAGKINYLAMSWKELAEMSKEGGDNAAGAFKEMVNRANKAVGNFSKVAGEVGNLFNTIMDGVKQHFEQMTATVQENLAQQISDIDAQRDAQLAAMGLVDETRTQTLQREIEELQAQQEIILGEKAKARLADEIATRQNEIAKEKIVTDAEAKKTAANKASAAEKARLEEQAFNANKATQIANIWLNTAVGVASAWASSMQLGPIAGPIMAGVLTTLLLANAGVQTGTVSQQTYKKPALAVGSDFTQAGQTLVGERGPELVNMPAGAQVLDASMTERALTAGGASIVIQNMTVVANNPQDFADQMIELNRMEIART